MIINKVYDILNQLSSKNSSGGYLPVPDFNNYAELIQNQKINFELEHKNSTTFKNEMISDYSKVVSLISTNGKALFPDDYRYYNSASYLNTKTFREAAFEELSGDEWNWRKSSDLDQPSEEYPACIVRDGFLEIAPLSVKSIRLDYIFTPPAPVYGYTVTNGRRVYNESTSTDFVFKEEDIPDLVYRMATVMGIELRDAELYQISKTEGTETK
jgi:hypothetical protein